jgi:hypothetical protein
MNIMETQHQTMAMASVQVPGSPRCNGSTHGSSDSGNLSGTEQDSDLKAPQHVMRAGQKRSPAEIEEAVMRKKLRNRESAQRARDRQKAR